MSIYVDDTNVLKMNCFFFEIQLSITNVENSTVKNKILAAEEKYYTHICRAT